MKLHIRNSSTRAAIPVAFTQSSTTPGAYYIRRIVGTTPVAFKTRRTVRTYIKGA